MCKTTPKPSPRQMPAVSGTIKVLQPIGTVGPAHNRTGEIEITSQTKRGPVTRRYFLTVHTHGYRLTSWDDKRREVTVYDLPASLDSCDCRDFASRSDRREDGLDCKHCRALRSLVGAGKVPAVECRPVVDYVAHEDAETDAWADAEGKAWHGRPLPFGIGTKALNPPKLLVRGVPSPTRLSTRLFLPFVRCCLPQTDQADRRPVGEARRLPEGIRSQD